MSDDENVLNYEMMHVHLGCHWFYLSTWEGREESDRVHKHIGAHIAPRERERHYQWDRYRVIHDANIIANAWDMLYPI